MDQKDTKILWGRAASRCSICKVELTQDKNATNGAFLIGEQAHIVGEKESAARGRSILTSEERNSYHNIILLCPNHHTEIDKNEDDWPVEKLHMVKSDHELWVQNTLSSQSNSPAAVNEVIYSALIDKAATLCELELWQNWTHGYLQPLPRCMGHTPDRIREFRQSIFRAIWPGTYPELESALKTLSLELHKLNETFFEHAESRDDSYVGIAFYKIRLFTEEEYQRLLAEYNEWVDRVHEAAFDATRAANWVCEEVRRYINPMFLATNGKLVVDYPEGLGIRTLMPEYTQEQKDGLPGSLHESLK